MNQYTNTNSDVQFDDLYLTGRLQRELITVTGSGGVFTADLDPGDAFVVNAGSNTEITMSVNPSNAGQSGTILIINGAGASFLELPPFMKTPSGAAIEWYDAPGGVSIISYFVVDQDNVLCNYIGNFA